MFLAVPRYSKQRHHQRLEVGYGHIRARLSCLTVGLSGRPRAGLVKPVVLRTIVTGVLVPASCQVPMGRQAPTRHDALKELADNGPYSQPELIRSIFMQPNFAPRRIFLKFRFVRLT